MWRHYYDKNSTFSGQGVFPSHTVPLGARTRRHKFEHVSSAEIIFFYFPSYSVKVIGPKSRSPQQTTLADGLPSSEGQSCVVCVQKYVQNLERVPRLAIESVRVSPANEMTLLNIDHAHQSCPGVGLTAEPPVGLGIGMRRIWEKYCSL